ncbi:hypothetical protein BN903_78 [Halorubrum sp. AJ67]|nr:hypothetical protein BN903_78 [Halorubrum sp. AJ67]
MTGRSRAARPSPGTITSTLPLSSSQISPRATSKSVTRGFRAETVTRWCRR